MSPQSCSRSRSRTPASSRRRGASRRLPAASTSARLTEERDTSPNISDALKRLEERELVRRELHPEDRRSMVVSLTEAGGQCVDEARDASVTGSEVFSMLTDEERTQLAALMRKALLALDDGPLSQDTDD